MGLVTVLYGDCVLSLQGPVGWLIGNAIGVALLTTDFLQSPTPAVNMAALSRNGFSGPVVIAIMLFNLVASNATSYGIVAFFCADYQVRWGVDVLAKIAAYLAVSEVAFTLAHRALHHNLPQLHVLHHACRTPSWSTNLMFHPIDLALEFAAPLGSIVLLHVTCFQDPWALLLTVGITHVWYAFDHDETVKLPHYRHHEHVDSLYTIYINWKQVQPGFDRVKPLLKP